MFIRRVVFGNYLSVLLAAVAVFATSPSSRGATFDPTFGDFDTRTSNPELARALKFVQAGNLDAAEYITRQVLKQQPNLAPGHEILGIILGTRGDLKTALAEFEQALKLDPRQSSAHTKMGDVHLALGQVDDAKSDFEAALAIDPSDRQAHQRLGLLADRAGQNALAIQHYELGLNGTPKDYIGIKVNLALLYNKTGQYERARDLLEPFSVEGAREPLIFRALGNAYLGLGRNQEAVKQYQAALELDTKDNATRIGLGIALRGLDQFNESATTLALAVSAAPNDVAAVIELAKTQLAAGKEGVAEQTLKTALDSNKKDSRFSIALAEFYVIGQKPDAAAAIYQRLIETKPAPMAAYIGLASLREAGGNLAAAEATLRGLIEAFPESPESYFRFGAILAAQKRYQEATAIYDKGLSIDSRNAGLLRGASVVSLRQQDIPKALVRAKALLAVTQDPRDKFYLATLLETAGDREQAQAAYRAILDAAPTNWEAMNNLAALLAQNGGRDADEAVRLARRAVEVAPQQAEVTDTLGWSQLKSGNALEAMKTLRLAVSQKPDNLKYQYHLAKAQQAGGDHAAARQTLQSILKRDPGHADAKQALEQLKPQ